MTHLQESRVAKFLGQLETFKIPAATELESVQQKSADHTDADAATVAQEAPAKTKVGEEAAAMKKAEDDAAAHGDAPQDTVRRVPTKNSACQTQTTNMFNMGAEELDKLAGYSLLAC